MTRALELACDHGGTLIEPAKDRDADPTPNDATRQWRSSFFRAPYVRDELARLGLISETFETAVTWDRFDALVDRITATTEDVLRHVGAWPAVVTRRLTHLYPDGAAPYFTVLAPGHATGRLAQWREVKDAVIDVLEASGATVTHHHAVGRDHRRGYDLERPPLFAAQLRAAKRVVDPAGLLNPGVLIDP
ncbi:MAG TPA: FAD-linked oxidase C-terminal domain-containing protein [Acidimicrobiales bacterium]|nr:FAD-linked oxidase C-terminal domain-containing protein [Acidimicrobiales bacterium]